jgi:hypothetical protein
MATRDPRLTLTFLVFLVSGAFAATALAAVCGVSPFCNSPTVPSV